ncbi:MAG: roadblock/LC7 domain-containing protein [Thermosynechococcaceae cyanobacterium]
MKLEQLIYTSLPGVGLRKLSSEQVPTAIQDSFLERIVHKHWNSYKPPNAEDHAIYLHQPNLDSCIFGWLYSDEIDEHSRNSPYFICYFLAEPLQSHHLAKILVCLQRGPKFFWDPNKISRQPLSLVEIDDVNRYEPARRGLTLSAKICRTIYAALEEQPLDIFLFQEDCLVQDLVELEHLESIPEYEEKVGLRAANPVEGRRAIVNSLDTISAILRDLMSKPIEIQCTFLVSADGQLLTPPIRMDENSALIISGTMLYLAKSTIEELQWEGIDKISIQGDEGHVILAYCTADAFLLVQTGKALVGLLDGEINRAIQKIQSVLLRDEPRTLLALEGKTTEALPILAGAEVPLEETELKYRGRPVRKSL